MENYHVAETFKVILLEQNCNIFSDLTKEDFKIIRKRIIELVLATDMTMHGKEVAFIKSKVDELNLQMLNDKSSDKSTALKNYLEISNSSTSIFTLQQEFLNILIHMADISNPTKPTDIYKNWTNRVMNEFWSQGDREKNLSLPVSFLCDRIGASIPKAQLGFMDGIVMPLLRSIVEIFPNLVFLKNNIENNKIAYKELLEKEEAEKLKTQENEQMQQLNKP